MVHSNRLLFDFVVVVGVVVVVLNFDHKITLNAGKEKC